MKKEYEKELRKISQVSGALIGLLGLLLLVALMSLIFVLQVVLSAPTATEGTVTTAVSGMSVNLGALQNAEFSTNTKIALSVVVVFAFAYICTFVVLGIRLLQCFRNRKLFSDASVRYARIIAWLYTASLLATPIVLLVSSRLSGEVSLNLSPNGLFILGLVWLFAWMLQVGRALQLDSELAI